jgi:spore germination protein KB
VKLLQELKYNMISVRQLLFVFIVIVSSPAIRLFPKYASDVAAQAGWLSALPSLGTLLLTVFVLNSFINKYDSKSLGEIIEIIMGKTLGKLLLFIYLIWAIILTALYLRYDVERLVSSIYPNMSLPLFSIVTLILVYYCLQSGFTVIARMSEIIMPIIVCFILALSALLIPFVRIDNIGPIYYNDIIPIFKGSFASMSVVSFLFYFFFLSENVSNKSNFKKLAVKTCVYIIIGLTFMQLVTIGTLGSSVAKRLPVPYVVAVKQISVLDIIENVEAIVVAVWMLSDFVFISALTVITLNIIKSIFNLEDTNHLLKVFLILTYYLSMGLGASRFQIEDFSTAVLIPVMQILCIIVPSVLFIIGKIRSKI